MRAVLAAILPGPSSTQNAPNCSRVAPSRVAVPGAATRAAHRRSGWQGPQRRPAPPSARRRAWDAPARRPTRAVDGRDRAQRGRPCRDWRARPAVGCAARLQYFATIHHRPTTVGPSCDTTAIVMRDQDQSPFPRLAPPGSAKRLMICRLHRHALAHLPSPRGGLVRLSAPRDRAWRHRDHDRWRCPRTAGAR